MRTRLLLPLLLRSFVAASTMEASASLRCCFAATSWPSLAEGLHPSTPLQRHAQDTACSIVRRARDEEEQEVFSSGGAEAGCSTMQAAVLHSHHHTHVCCISEHMRSTPTVAAAAACACTLTQVTMATSWQQKQQLEITNKGSICTCPTPASSLLSTCACAGHDMG